MKVWLNGGENSAAPGHWVWYPQGVIATGAGEVGANIRLADLNADGKADYIMLSLTGVITAYLNGGQSSSAPNGWAWYPAGQIASGATRLIGDVQFADVNGDGRADYLVTDTTTGAVSCYLNAGGDKGSQPGWISMGVIASGVGAPKGSPIIFADINNDGHADYLSVNANDGSVKAWLNGGLSSTGKQIWYPQGQLSPGGGAPTPLRSIHLADINGDGKADLLAVDSKSAVRAWLNNGLDTTQTAGWLTVGFILDSADAPSGTQFVLADIDGDGRADNISINPATGSSQVWINGGPQNRGWHWNQFDPNNFLIPTPLPGSIFTFADIDGDGKADLLAIDPATGAYDAWQTLGQLTVPGQGPAGFNFVWLGHYTAGFNSTGRFSILDAGTHALFADLNGDGKADCIVVDLVSGIGYAWLNGGPSSTGSWIWNLVGDPVTLETGAHGYLYFADLNGDRKADFLIVQNNGSVLSFLNQGPSGDGWSWKDQGQIATGVALPDKTHDVRFADMDGDGRADYLVLNPVNGGIPTLYLYNGGNGPRN